MLNILIAVEKPLLCKGFKALFHDNKDIRLWYADSIDSKPQLGNPSSYDVIVFSGSNVDRRSIHEKIATLKEKHSESNFVLIGGNLRFSSVVELCKVGVLAFVDEHATNEQISSAVLAASRNDLYLSSSMVGRLRSSDSLSLDAMLKDIDVTFSDINRLSERELEIIKLVARGMSNRAIAENLFISEKTVKNHLYNVFPKLGVRDRTQAVMAVVKGLLSYEYEAFGST